MTNKTDTVLPPKPTLNLTSLEKRSNSFAEVDRIVSSQLAKYPPSADLKLYMTKAGTNDPLFYARRCIVLAGLEAWQRANEWEDQRSIVQANIAKIVGQIDDLVRTNNDLKRLAETVTARDKELPLIADPNMVANRTEYFGVFRALLEATGRIEAFAYDDLAEVKRTIENRDYGRKDVLAEEFIGNLARIWKTFFGEQPSTVTSGPFVDLADEAWKALGWGVRSSLGKKILRKAKDENWSELKQLDRHVAGTS